VPVERVLLSKVRFLMIIVKITMNALREKQEEIMQTLLAMIESMSKEKECRNYQVYRNIEDGTSFSSIGEWETRNDLYRYLKSDKFGVLLGTKSLLSEPIQIRIHTVSHSEGIKLVQTIRKSSILLDSPAVRQEEFQTI
jgi:quinol monooxygenase YgiN